MKLPPLAKEAKQASRQAYWATMIISVLLFVTGFLMPPMGQIHPTVLYACGALMLFTTIFLFILSRMNVRFSADLDDKKINVDATHPDEPSK